MKKVVLLSMLLLIPMQSFADDSFWASIRKKIETITPKKKLATTTAVGGVRGSLADADDLYWKSEVVDVEEMELKAFKHAVTLAEAGKTDEAKVHFREFLADYPSSPLRADASSALDNL